MQVYEILQFDIDQNTYYKLWIHLENYFDMDQQTFDVWRKVLVNLLKDASSYKLNIAELGISLALALVSNGNEAELLKIIESAKSQ